MSVGAVLGKNTVACSVFKLAVKTEIREYDELTTAKTYVSNLRAIADQLDTGYSKANAWSTAYKD